MTDGLKLSTLLVIFQIARRSSIDFNGSILRGFPRSKHYKPRGLFFVNIPGSTHVVARENLYGTTPP